MKKDIDKIADYLLLRSADMQDVGFFHGKTGVVAALYLYADAGGDDVLRDFAWELFQQVYDGVHTEMPLGLERGLAGIGYATAWLCRRGLLEGSLNDTLADIDAKIMEHDPRRLTDMSVRTGWAACSSTSACASPWSRWPRSTPPICPSCRPLRQPAGCPAPGRTCCRCSAPPRSTRRNTSAARWASTAVLPIIF